MSEIARKFVGYCNRCGGDCYDDGVRHFHKCPPERPEARAIVRLKFQLDRMQNIMDRKPWAAVIRKDDFDDLKAAMAEARKILTAVYGDGQSEDRK